MSAGNRALPQKTCRVCGRRIAWRKKWEIEWENVRYCSSRCRRRRLDALDRELEEVILELLRLRPGGSSLCPSEAARRVRPQEDDWRGIMERTREAGRRLVAAGRVEFTQEGRVVDPSTARGPIRLRLQR